MDQEYSTELTGCMIESQRRLQVCKPAVHSGRRVPDPKSKCASSQGRYIVRFLSLGLEQRGLAERCRR